jgi:hypothetical protein
LTTSRLIRQALCAGLVLVVAVYAAMIVHDFYTYADRAVYVAVDDGEANIAYSIATLGRYAFPASPVLLDMSRMQGQFNYGPWYFYLGAAVVWFFGFSLTALRSIHLWVIVGASLAAFAWFRGRDRVVAPALFALTALYFFGVAEWPMVRPDSLVSLFAVALLVASGLGFRLRQARYWLIAGLAAACGAFTHLVAASLVVSSVLLLAWFVIVERHGDRGQVDGTLVGRATAALIGGLTAGAAMFYASFHFGIATQWRFLHGYRNLTATGESYSAAILHHFHIAFGFLPSSLQASVWIVLAIAWLLVLTSLARPALNDIVCAYVGPPVVVWSMFILSNGAYTNYHQGYAILHHVLSAWTAAAIVFVLMQAGDSARTSVIRVGVTALVLAFGVRLSASHLSDPPRERDAVHRVSFNDYAARVVGPIPSRAVAWGSVIFGMEAPDRLQLVQLDDAGAMIRALPPADRTQLAPDYLVFGYPEVREEVLNAPHAGGTLLDGVHQLLPDVRFRLVSLVDGAPYGVTRVYARVADENADAALAPSVASYDEVHRHWLTDVEPPVPTRFDVVPPRTLRIGHEVSPPGMTASSSVAADVPPGRYLLRIRVTQGVGTSRRLIAVNSATMITQTVYQLGVRPEGDFADYLAGDREVFALSAHPGGTLFVNQFDENTGAAIESVTISRLNDTLYEEPFASRNVALPPFDRWIPQPGVRMVLRSNRLQVDGTNSSDGYQLYSPVIRAEPGEHVEVEIPNRTIDGELCVGALNAKGEWLLPASVWRERMDFRGDSTKGFRVVLANCQTIAVPVLSRFDVWAGWYRGEARALYADRLVAFGLGRGPATAGGQATPFSADAAPVRLTEADVAERAPIVTGSAGAWSIHGSVTAADTLLLRSRPRFVDNETRLIVSGTVSRGGISVGLRRGDDWIARETVTDAGDFSVMLAPSVNGQYSIAIASTSGPMISSTLSRVDLVPPLRPPR